MIFVERFLLLLVSWINWKSFDEWIVAVFLQEKPRHQKSQDTPSLLATDFGFEPTGSIYPQIWLHFYATSRVGMSSLFDGWISSLNHTRHSSLVVTFSVLFTSRAAARSYAALDYFCSCCSDCCFSDIGTSFIGIL